MRNKSFFTILLTVTIIFEMSISMPTLAMYKGNAQTDNKKDKLSKTSKKNKKNKKKLAKLVVAKLFIGDNEIRDEQVLAHPESPKLKNSKKEQKLKKQTKNLKKSRRHSLSDDISNIEDIRVEIDQKALEKDAKYKKELKQEAFREIYLPEEADFTYQDEGYESEEDVAINQKQDGEQEQEDSGLDSE